MGHPRVVINGTCLDYLAESFMAGNPLNGGGVVVLNGVSFDEKGEPMKREKPYPWSLCSYSTSALAQRLTGEGSTPMSTSHRTGQRPTNPRRRLLDQLLRTGLELCFGNLDRWVHSSSSL